MAFLTSSDIAGSLPSGYDTAQVDRLLLSAEASLRSIGLVFTDEAESSRDIEVEESGRSVFSITPLRLLNGVVIQNSQGTTIETLSLGTDYITRSHRNISGYITQIELLDYRLHAYDTLQLTGKWGIYVDFTASSNYEQKLLRAGIIDWVRSQLNVKLGQSTIQKGIKSAKTGNSTVTFGDYNPQSSGGWLITEDPDFQQILDWFYA